MSLIRTLLRTIRRYRMVPVDGRIVVALSGGADSVGLVHLLREAADDGRFRIAALAHFNHQLRPGAADADEAFCRDLAATLGVPIEVGSADVRTEAARERRSIEDTARALRYAFLHGVAQRAGADAIAVGHTRDDQAETFLLRMIRGAGTRGLGGIRPKAGLVIRPMIGISRSDLRSFVARRGLAYREDDSNADVAIPRNRIRHELLPYLEQNFSPNIVEVLAREAILAQMDDDRLQLEAIDLASSVVLSNTDAHSGSPRADTRIVIAAEPLRSMHPALALRVLRGALETVSPGRFIGFDALQQLRQFALEAEAGARVSLPGCEAAHEGERVRLGPAPPRSVSDHTNSFRLPLSIPGEVVLPAQAVSVSASWAEGTATSTGVGALGGYVQAAQEPLAIRSRKPGDRFQPPGLGGRTKKLQDYFVDRKVARKSRDLVPLVVDAHDRIIWVVGHGFSEGFRAPGPSAGVILLKARRLGGEV